MYNKIICYTYINIRIRIHKRFPRYFRIFDLNHRYPITVITLTRPRSFKVFLSYLLITTHVNYLTQGAVTYDSLLPVRLTDGFGHVDMGCCRGYKVSNQIIPLAQIIVLYKINS